MRALGLGSIGIISGLLVLAPLGLLAGTTDVLVKSASSTIDDPSHLLPADYDVHNPIRIAADEDFDTQGWPGS